MRYLNTLFCALMVLFVVVQYNDPDGPLWMLIYAVPAIFAGLAAFRPDWLSGRAGLAALGAAILSGTALVVYYWPVESSFWSIDVWWQSETAREGMGAMVALIVLLSALAGSWMSSARS